MRYSLVRKLFTPATFIRFRRLARRLSRCGDARTSRFPQAVALGRLLFWSRKKLRSVDDPLTSILFFLNVFAMERGLASLEAWLRGRTLVMDEGYVQHALGVWLRSPDALRERILREYLDGVPRGGSCIALICDPERALERAGARPRGVPKIMKKGEEADRGHRFSPRYAQLADVLDSRDLKERFSWSQVEARGSVEEVADAVLRILRAARSPMVVFARN